MKKTVSLFFIIFVTLTGCGEPLLQGKITIRVVDEDGNLITNANSVVAWSYPKSLENLWGGYVEKTEKGMVSNEGLFTSFITGSRDVTLHAFCDGYYRSSKVYTFTGRENNQYQPWNPVVTLRLRKIGTPIDMYGKRINGLKMPNSEVKYDLVKGDFLPPHGKGEIADCILSAHIKDNGPPQAIGSTFEDFYSIKFLGDFNGFIPIFTNRFVQESRFKWPRFSSNEGYNETEIQWLSKAENQEKPNLKGQLKRITTTTRIPDTRFFFFRIRSDKNLDGTFKSALYGKMISPFNINYAHDSKVITLKNLEFYVNPTRNDRNMEDDVEYKRTLSSQRYSTESSQSGQMKQMEK